MERKKGSKTEQSSNLGQGICSYKSRSAPFPSSRIVRVVQDYDSRSRAPRYTETGGRKNPGARHDFLVSVIQKGIRGDEIRSQRNRLLADQDPGYHPTRQEETLISSSSGETSSHQHISRHIHEVKSERSDQKKHGTRCRGPTIIKPCQNIASNCQQERAAHNRMSIGDSSSQPRSSLGSPAVFTSKTIHSLTKRSIETDCFGDRRSSKKQRLSPIFHVDTRKRGLSIEDDRTSPSNGIKRQRIDSFDSKPIGYKRLEEICRESDPDKVVMQLTADSGRFKSLLESGDIRVDLVKLLIQTLSKVQASTCIVSANSFLSYAWHKNGGFLICHLSPFISAIPQNFSRFDNVSKLLQQICDVLGAMLNRFEKMIVHHISPVILQLKETVDKLHRDGRIQGKEVSERIEKLLLLKDAVSKEAASGDGTMATAVPPDDFRALEIIPQRNDFHLLKKPFLRANIVDGTYDDLDHYLDVQFRLLREDFIIPLRDCIKEIISSAIQPHEFEATNDEFSGSHRMKTRNGKSLHMYHNVSVLNPVCSEKKMVYRIRFDAQHKSIRNLKWNRSSKRLKFGSLVCLSSDNFETLHIATVEGRDIDGLEVGELEVRFEDDTARDVNDFINHKTEFDMVESPTFFEAYRHVLKALQNLNQDSLPFQEYIVHCNKNVRPPVYLTQSTTDGNDPVYNLTTVSSSNFVEAELASRKLPSRDLAKVSILSLNEWPCAEALGLNESQLRAFQLALTKEFAVIQGPPGTGKTYVGQKIVRALLDNREVWQRGTRSPLLMISYTNHALDQFVEGLLDVHGVVRVGGRCKNSRVQEEFSLKNLRMERRQRHENPREMKSILRARRKVMAQLRDLKQSMGLEKAAHLLRTSRRCIISLKLLKEFMRSNHFRYFNRDLNCKGDEELLQWLKIEKVRNKDDHQSSSHNFYESEDFHRQFSVRFFADEEDETGDENHGMTPACTLNEAKNSYRLKSLLGNPATADAALERRINRIGECSFRQRWMLYRLWRQRLENHYRRRLQDNQERYEEILAKKQEVELEEDKYILSQSKVIAMTTTCAARYSSILQRISPKVIIAEEAAEVLEAHVVTALNPGCQHLILIGDHQQLRPNPNVYYLAKRFKLDVSLFERMVHVGLDCVRLSVQHRMRPEISALMRHIYNDLQDCKEVSEYENVIGMKKNLFFLNHQEPEHENEDSHSYYNLHEAQILVALCRYLLQQGYKPSQVTMLTSYTGQMFTIRERVRSLQDDEVNSVRLTTVDNFQGEENDIILLSLVRSNTLDKPGFIKVTNRACVALSRAKIGFYCVGNFDLLSKHSEIWCKIVDDLRKNEFIGKRLSLICPRHNNKVTEVKCSEDFERDVKFGGCQEPCLVRLPCGHTCPKNCHSDDRDHRKFRCNKECTKRISGCNYGHPCPNLCFEMCPKKCAAEVQKTLPCHHTQEVRCWVPKTLVKCKSPCEKALACGHQCQKYCGELCTTDCKELVKRRDWACGHEITIACSATQEDCTVPCSAVLKCGHVCSGKCGECRQGRVHMPCKYECGRILVCSHLCKELCAGPCPSCSHPCENSCFHSKCDKKCGEECVPCMEECRWKCKHISCNKFCSQLCERKRCNRPCNNILLCRHRCRGLCNEDCICVQCDTNGDKEPITSIFLGGEDEEDARFIKLKDCKHIFAVSDMDSYMNSYMEQTGTEIIQLKGCPRCTTPIRRSYRYGNVIKRTLIEIAKVKEKLRGNKKECRKRQQTLRQKIAELKEKFPARKSKFGDQPKWGAMESRAEKGTDDSSLATLENQLILTQTCCELMAKVKEEVLAKEKTDPERKIRVDCLFILTELQYMIKRTNASRTSQREMGDVNTELSRLSLFVELCRLQADAKCNKVELQDSHQKIVAEIRDVMESRKLVNTDALTKYREDLASVRREYPGLSPISPEEKRQIVKAMNLQKGHWFACPQGHVYAIGECGGAMERSRCPECDAVIGGERHRLVEGNTLAREMDGAQYPAWSEQANLENYELV